MNRPSIHEKQLCLNILKEQFGKTVANVAQILLFKGSMTLLEILKVAKSKSQTSQLTPIQIRKSLLILIQHNILRMKFLSSDVSTVVSLSGATENVKVVYDISSEDIITRLRFAKLIYLAKQKFGLIGEVIITEVLFHGRMGMNSIVDSSFEKINSALTEGEISLPDVGINVPNLSHDSPTAQNQLQIRVRETAENLIKRRYLVRVHPLNFTPQAAPPAFSVKESKVLQGVTLTARGAAALKGKDAKAGADGKDKSSTVKRKRKANPSPTASSGRIPVELSFLQSGPNDNKPSETLSIDTTAEASQASDLKNPPSKRRRRVIESVQTGSNASSRASSPVSNIVDNTLVWRVGYDQFHRDFRHELLISLARDKVNEVGEVILKTMIKLTEPNERDRSEHISSQISAKQIYDDIGTTANIRVEWGTLLQYLELMMNDKSSLIQKSGFSSTKSHDGGTYHISMAKAIEYLQKQTVHTIIQEKYGIESARMLQVLRQKKQLEQQQFENLVLISANDARRRLYELLRDQVVKLQEIPQRSDYNPQHTFYTWSMNEEGIRSIVLDTVYRSLLNLRIRRQHDFEANKDLIERSIRRQTEMESQQNGGAHSKLESNPLEVDEARYAELIKALNRLDQSVAGVDDTLLLFSIF